MLKIQRASAGSGKTYTLAKDYILNLIAFKSETGKWRLRNEKQIEEAPLHLMAITFTNKATNEMKKRIIKNLSMISQVADPNFLLNNDPYSIPYLNDFSKLTSASFREIGEAATLGLKIILNNFSLFKISTIDSFFQEILRTFTYEANINTSYQLELDSAYINGAAVDEAIYKLDSRPSEMGNASFWIKIIMTDEAKKSQQWNPFNRRISSRSLYARIIKALHQLESEDFKEIKNTLDSHYKNPENIQKLKVFYIDFRKKAFEERNQQLQALKNACRKAKLLTALYPEEQLNKNFLNHLKIVDNLKIDSEIVFKFQSIVLAQSVFKKKFRSPDNDLDEAALKFYELIEEWIEPGADSYFKNWLIYGELIPYLGLILEIRHFITKILDSNNLIQLSDTNYILKKIIGDEDSPFVYERLGSRIDHFLIDEFQDTSRMQWDIIYPLLNESVARNMDNLIIGDPKQSIYRFRNADHTLITSVVPQAFNEFEAAGLSKEENTNWRSHTRIVEFNNYLFKNLAVISTLLSKENGNAYDFNDLYANVIQFPNNQGGKGYVEINFCGDAVSIEQNDSADSQQETIDIKDSYIRNEIPPLISNLISRGYHPEDIAVLVNTNEKGKEVVNAIIEYNETANDSDRINFISEESLLISSSPAIEIVIGILEKIANIGTITQTEKDKETSKKYFDWNKIKIDFTLFSIEKKDLSLEQRVIQFISNPEFGFNLKQLLSELPMPSLPAMVESIIKTFIDEETSNKEALYISSFQDALLDFCAGYPNDLLSFLDWWKTRGHKLSVASPDSTKAVNIMTIHKSKGLEFKCVIVPFSSDKFIPTNSKSEWKWVTPYQLPQLEMPPFLPVETVRKLMGSFYQSVYTAYFDQVLTDRINMYYVAFTRAKNELYIFSDRPSKSFNSLPDFFKFIFIDKTPLDIVFSEAEKDWLPEIEKIKVDEKEINIIYGQPLTSSEIEEEYLKEKKESESEIRIFNNYYINNHRPKLRSLASMISSPDDL